MYKNLIFLRPLRIHFFAYQITTRQSSGIQLGEARGGGPLRAMQIRVKCGCGETSCPEWAVVELQGVVQPQLSFSGRIQGLHIGRLCSAAFPSSKAGYTFTVGYHELSGTKVTLKKPLLVLRKKKKANAGELEPVAAVEEVELEVIGVIRHKILFKDRPKALISKPQPKEKKALPSAAP